MASSPVQPPSDSPPVRGGGQRRRLTPSTAYVVLVCLSCVAFLIFATSVPWIGRIELAVIGFCVLIGVPFGIQMGTQDKFWT